MNNKHSSITLLSLIAAAATTVFLNFEHVSVSMFVSGLSSIAPPKKFYGGAGIGRFTLDDGVSWQCAYDMVLVERIQGKPKTNAGLFVPQEDMPKLHLCRGK